MVEPSVGEGGADDATVVVGPDLPNIDPEEYAALAAAAWERTVAFARDEVERMRAKVAKAEADVVAAQQALAESEARLAAIGG